MLGLEQYLKRKPARCPVASGSGRPWAGHRPGTAGVPDGRAAVQPGRQAPGVDAGLADPAAPPARRDHRVRDPRPGRGDDPGHRVCVLRDGQLQQVDTPQTLFDAPVNLFVAGFIGSPAMNIVSRSWSGTMARR